jgi:hypothetical protein
MVNKYIEEENYFNIANFLLVGLERTKNMSDWSHTNRIVVLQKEADFNILPQDPFELRLPRSQWRIQQNVSGGLDSSK